MGCTQQGFPDLIFLCSPSHVNQGFRIRIKALIQRLLKSMEKLSLSLVSLDEAPKVESYFEWNIV